MYTIKQLKNIFNKKIKININNFEIIGYLYEICLETGGFVLLVKEKNIKYYFYIDQKNNNIRQLYDDEVDKHFFTNPFPYYNNLLKSSTNLLRN